MINKYFIPGFLFIWNWFKIDHSVFLWKIFFYQNIFHTMHQKKKIEVYPNIKALIFDCDGTLADSMPLHMLAWKIVFRELGEPYREAFLDPLKGMNDEEIVKLYNKTFHREFNPKEVVDRKHDYFLSNIKSVHPIQPVIDIVKRYRNFLPLAVVSGGRRKSVFSTLSSLGIKKYFSIILTADDPIPPKPAPDLFITVAKFLKVNTEFCQVFEDGDMGIRAAQSIGMKTTDIRLYIK
jgi:HAD superfamily hydrolase (TIGR01509 family)